MASAKQVCLLDWGFFDNLRLIQKTAVNLSHAEEPASSYQQQIALAQISDGNNLFVMHSKGCEIWAERQTAFLSFAAKNGYERANIQVFRDRNGRACIELFRFAR